MIFASDRELFRRLFGGAQRNFKNIRTRSVKMFEISKIFGIINNYYNFNTKISMNKAYPYILSGAREFASMPLMLLFGCLATSCQIAADLTVEDDPNSIRSASAISTEIYEPKSAQEKVLDDEIAAEAELFKGKVAVGVDSSPSQIYDRSSGVAREEWWNGDTKHALLSHSGSTVHMGLDEIYQRTIAHSSQVKAFASLPLIRETGVDEARGEFDTEAFAESRYDGTDEPTGSLLETGNPDDYFKEQGWTLEGGIRKKFGPGTTVGLSQEFSRISNNSDYFVPGNQGNARLKLSVMQPLLRGAGAKYNESLIQIAKLDSETGYDEFIRQAETHLMEVNRTYWALYLARTDFLEKRRLVGETEAVVTEIESRTDLDSVASQRSRARSALASRKSDLIRSELAIKNAESRLRTLINDPIFVEQQIGEIIPTDLPISTSVVPDFGSSIKDALSFRPEINQAENQLRAADIRESMAENEKLPSLDLVGDVGISALRAEGDWSGAFNDQYNDGRPTWGVGLVASVPLERRAAKARHLRTELEVRQKKDQLRATMDTVLLEVQIAHREVTTAWPEAKAKSEAARAADQELEMLRDRREIETAESGTSLYLEKLLDAQDRRALARDEFLRSLVIYNAALTNLERSKGTLLQQEGIGVERTEDDQHLPLIQLTKKEASDYAKNLYEKYK